MSCIFSCVELVFLHWLVADAQCVGGNASKSSVCLSATIAPLMHAEHVAVTRGSPP